MTTETFPTPWKFIDSYETYVWRKVDESTEESVWIEHPRIQAWLAEGNIIEPYIAPTVIGDETDLAKAKGIASDSVRSTAYSLLQPTDWVVVREAETGVAPSADITTYRAAVRTASSDKVAVIESKTKLSALQDYLRSDEFAAWPEPPTA